MTPRSEDPSTLIDELAEALRKLLPSVGWSNMSDEEMHEEARLGNGVAPKILAARSALARYDASKASQS